MCLNGKNNYLSTYMLSVQPQALLSLSVSSSFGYAIPPVLSVLVHAHTNSESISRHFFQLLATLHICILAMHGMHMLNFRHTGGSLHNVWVWGCPVRGDGGEADVLSALLHSPVLSWWGESPAEGEGGGEEEWEDGEAEAWRQLWGASH